MRYLVTLVFLLFLGTPSHAQFGSQQLEAELRSFSDKHKDRIPASYFIDSAFYTEYRLVKQPGGGKRLLVLDGTAKKGNDILLVMECLWKFDDKKQLDSFVTKFRPAFSLNGIRVNAPNAVPGARMISLYKDGKDFKKWNDSLKHPAAGFYNFVFAVGNVVANIYVQTRKDVPLENAAIFAIEAAERLKLAMGKK